MRDVLIHCTKSFRLCITVLFGASTAKQLQLLLVSVLKSKAVESPRRAFCLTNKLILPRSSFALEAAFSGSTFWEERKLGMFHEIKSLRTNTRNNLLAAAIEGNKDALLSSLDAGAAVDEMDIFHVTPLMHAARNGHLDCVRLLIGRGADVHKRSGSGNGFTAAHYAAQGGHVEMLLALFDAGVAIDVTSSNLMTPLMCAASGANL